MKKYVSLIKACLSTDMSIFRLNLKNKSKINHILLPIIASIIIMVAIGSYAVMFIEPLLSTNNGFIILSLFVFITFLLTLIEGAYKSGSILFNCKDDDLLLSLPISKKSVIFVRLFKFYLFELLYNSLFLLPVIVVYAYYVKVGFSYYIVSLLMLLLLPIIPIILSCIIGIITSSLASRFKHKNLFQIIISFIFVGLIMVLSSNIESLITKFAEKANSINEIITKIYYPAGLYASLVNNFNIFKLLLFIAINILLFVGLIIIFSKFYFKINTRSKSVSIHKTSKITAIKKKSITVSIIKKEVNRIFTTPVLVVNSIFGLIIFVIAAIAIVYKFDGIITSLLANDQVTVNITKEMIISYIPLVNITLIILGSFMSSITSSLISLEGKSFMILKTIPVNPIKIIMSKVYSALLIMLPFILLGDILLIIYFKYNVIMIILTLLASIIIPLCAEVMGIIINLKYPKMNASNDTEIVKQSASSFISVLAGMVTCAAVIWGAIKLIGKGVNLYVIMVGILLLFIVFLGSLCIYLKKKGITDFNNIIT